MFSLLLNIISLTISFAFPLVTTYKALKSNDLDLLKPWIIYWLIYSSLATLEHQFYSILKFVPFFSFIKLYVSIWLILPQTQGSLFLYDQYLKPFLNHYEHDFDQFVNNWVSKSPVELILSLINGSKTKTTKSIGDESNDELLTKSYFDIFAQSFYQNSKTPANSKSSEENIFHSLFGVLGSFQQQAPATTPASGAGNSSFESPGSATTVFTVSNYNDFDAFGNEEYVNIVANEQKSPLDAQKNGWFGNWWTGASNSSNGVNQVKQVNQGGTTSSEQPKPSAFGEETLKTK